MFYFIWSFAFDKEDEDKVVYYLSKCRVEDVEDAMAELNDYGHKITAMIVTPCIHDETFKCMEL